MSGNTVGIVVARYIAERARRGEFTGGTIAQQRSVLGHFARAAGLDTPIGDLQRRHVRRWWSQQAVAVSTARNRLSTVRTFLRWCVEEELLAVDPSRGIKSGREPRRAPRVLSRRQVAEVIMRCPDARARFIVTWMVQLGLRCCELANLRLEDVDWRGQAVLIRGKGANERWLPITDAARRALDDYLAASPAATGPIVRRLDTGGAITAQRIGDLVRKLMMVAGVKIHAYDGRSGHGLRRTCATDMLDEGAHIRAVQAILGHANLATTEHYLARSNAQMLREAMEGRSYAG